ncbi:Phosphate transporter [Caenorhabditis elegans]|uniref:Phosphate transporter n=1 Tax=Caenorhabditis elegans TaxID=6239 RepID=O45220_CAEEL|nr:Phosphate transporter [Caenorhabditis elegans]CAB11776.1 Phosphate transporter [Caenorhabditis elegans]|eukprot:NP_505491.1 Phosphate transporter [Caenorhabditis elegans]
MLDILLQYAPNWTEHATWLVIVAFIFAFFVSYGMGANDSCNDWGPAVGAGTVTLPQAYFLSGILNVAGAVLLGYKVIETLRTGIIEFDIFDVYAQYNETTHQYDTVDHCGNATLIGGWKAPDILPGAEPLECAKYTSIDFMLTQTASLAGVAAFMILSSCFKIPVSATHAIVGASVATSFYIRGNVGIKWGEIINIVVSWFISPIIAGTIAATMYYIIKYSVLIRQDTFKWALRLCPIFMCFTLVVNLYACIYDGSKYLGLDRLDAIEAFLISVAIGVTGWAILTFPLRNWLPNRAHRLYDKETVKMQRRMEAGKATKSHKIKDMREPDVADNIKELPWYKYLWAYVPEDRLTKKVFNTLQIISSSMLSFTHGANDTGNTIAPLLAIWLCYESGYAFGNAETRDDTQMLLAYGSLAMIVGFVTLGHRTIKLLAHEMTVDMSPISGFCIEVGTAFTVLICVKFGIPISSTHCTVGAVVFVGMAKSTSEGVSFGTFRKICFFWLLCFPMSAIIGIGATIILQQFL